MKTRKPSGAETLAKRNGSISLRLIDCQKQRREEQQRDTIAVLRVLLDMANRGEVTSLLVSYRDGEGRDRCVSSGDYRSDPAVAVNAAMRIAMRMTQAQDEE